MEGVLRRHEVRQLERNRLSPCGRRSENDRHDQGASLDELIQSHYRLPLSYLAASFSDVSQFLF
jgi:hypothetical protein